MRGLQDLECPECKHEAFDVDIQNDGKICPRCGDVEMEIVWRPTAWIMRTHSYKGGRNR